jgi:PAS domain S-box-containing protein
MDVQDDAIFSASPTSGSDDSQDHMRRQLAYFAHAPLAAMVVDACGRYVEVNPAACRITGYGEQELLAMSLADLVAEESLDAGRQHFAHVKETGRASGELCWIRKDGAKRWSTCDAVKLSEDRFIGFFLDVTDRKRAEDTLRRSQAELRAIYDHVPAIVCVMTSDRRVQYANRAMCEFVGRLEESLKGERACGILGCINALDDPRGCGYGSRCESCQLRLAILDTFQTGTSHRNIDYRATIQHAGKQQEMWFLGSTARLPNGDNGDQPSLLLCLEDITARQQAEERSRLLAGLLDASPTSTTVHDRQGNFLYANEKTFALHGYNREEFFRLNLHELDAPESAKCIEPRMLDISQTGGASFEVQHRRKDGTAVPLRVDAKLARWGDQDVILSVATDVSDLKRSEQTLREREGRLRGILNSVSESVFLIDREGIVLECNETTAKRLGRAVDDLLGKSIYGFIPPDLAETRRAQIQRVVETRQPVQFEDQRAGIWFEQIIYPIVDDSGRIAEFAVFGRDVSERKSNENQLQLQSLVLSQIQDRVTVTDLEGVITYVNDAECESLRRSRESLVGQSVISYGDDPGRGATQLEVIRKTAEDGKWRGEIVNYAADGTEIIMDCRTTLVRDPQGRAVAMCGIATDITARKRAEESLRQSEEHYRVLAETMLQGVVHQDRAGTIIAMNPAAERILGKGPEQFMGSSSVGEEHCTIREDGSPFPGLEHPAMVALRTGQQVRNAVMGVFNPKAAAYRWINVDAVPLFRPGENRPYQVYTVFEDITDRRRAEQEKLEMERRLLQAQKHESLGTLAGGIAHDFNNILAAIMGYADLAKLRLPPSEPVREDLDVILQAAQRAADLTRQMLAYSGSGKFLVEAVNLSQVVEDSRGMLALAVSRKATVTYNLATDLPLIRADATQMRQVVMNLVINASEALGEEVGQIIVSTRALRCIAKDLATMMLGQDLPEGLYVCLEITDTGGGMSPQTLARIFEPFFTTKFVGRGLGASAVHGIMRGHKGGIRISSELGTGTSFQVFFPASGPSFAAVANGSDASPRRGNGVVLVVDDEEMVRNLARRTIEKAGFSVLTASNGEEAVHLYLQHQQEIVVVLLDLTMPKMNGEETFRELRRISPEVRVILSSGFSEEGATERFSGLGLAGFIQKPYQIDALIAKLKEACRPW